MSIFIDLTGHTYRRLTVLSQEGRNSSGDILWLCRCSCGTEKKVIGGHLRHGNTVSCGCRQKEVRDHSLPLGVSACNQVFRGYKQNAKNRSLTFSLSQEEFIEISSQNCHYCGASPTAFRIKKDLLGSYMGNGIDRKDNNLGYVKSNCLPCCKHCNHAKATRTYDEFIGWLRKAAAHLLLKEKATYAG